MTQMEEDEAASLELVRKMLADGGVRGISVRLGARVHDLRTYVFSNGGRSFAVDANRFLHDDPVQVVAAAISQVLTPEELQEWADRVS